VTPQTIVPRVDQRGARDLLAADLWSRVPALGLRRAEDGAAPEQATTVRVAHDEFGLRVRFECADRDIWATHTERDAPLWQEEAVEVFIAPGEGVPAVYLEFEVNPLGAIFDARVANPHGRRDTMRVDTTWNAAGLVVEVDRPSPGSWRVDLAIPWGDLSDGAPPRLWRANFFRIERPRDGEAEFSCWSPTLTRPPDFHLPARFGTLILERAGELP